MGKLEREIQPRIIKEIERRLPGVQIFKGDARFKQGAPDLIVLYQDRWAALEVKKDATARRQPNQPYYNAKLNGMSYAAFIHPGNEEDILDDLERTLQAPRDACVPLRIEPPLG